MNKIITIAVLFGVLLGSTIAINPISAQEVLPPRQQIKNGVAPEDVVCKDGYELILRSNGKSVACVKPLSSSKLVDSGWAKSILKTVIELRNQVGKIGTVSIISMTERAIDEKKLDTSPNLKAYNVVFQACAGPTKIVAPQVLVASDSESKAVRLGSSLNAEVCQTSATTISATYKGSVKATLIKKTDISTIVASLESKVNDLKTQLETEKNNLKTLAIQEPKGADYVQKISDTTDKIIKLRNDLNNARAELQRNNYLLYVGDPKALDPKIYESLVSLTKEKIPQTSEDTDLPHVNKVSTVRNFSEEKKLDTSPRVGSYSFIFQACAGNSDIKFPEVIVKSDGETKSVKIGTSIPAKTCQTTSTTIKAADPESINGILVTTGSHSILVKELEEKVADLKMRLDIEKKALGEITKISHPPEDFTQRVTEMTDKIIDLRNQLNSAREELTRLTFMINQ